MTSLWLPGAPLSTNSPRPWRRSISVRESHRLGFGSHCCREATILNRVMSVGLGDDGRKFLWIEPDARHSELVFKSLGLKGDVKSVAVPGVKLSEEDVARRKVEPLSPFCQKQKRACFARM